MTPTAGSGVFGLLLRFSGTFVAMCMSFVIWYVAGGRGSTAGVVNNPRNLFLTAGVLTPKANFTFRNPLCRTFLSIEAPKVHPWGANRHGNRLLDIIPRIYLIPFMAGIPGLNSRL